MWIWQKIPSLWLCAVVHQRHVMSSKEAAVISKEYLLMMFDFYFCWKVTFLVAGSRHCGFLVLSSRPSGQLTRFFGKNSLFAI